MELKKVLTAFFLVVVVLVSFGLGFWFGKDSVVYPVCPPQEIDFSLFWEAYHKLQEKFVDKEKFDIQKIIYGAISGMVKSLEDPYTVFFPPEEAKRFEEDVKGFFEGVGMEIGIKKGQLQVIAPLEGTPAQKVGLRPGDKILEIDGKSTIDMTIEEALNLIRGPKGTEVTLTIFREEWVKTQEFKIIRAVIEVPSLKWEILASPGEAGGKDSDIAYLKLYHFTEKADSDFKIAGFEILNSPAKKIILDLRNNPGGYLEVAQKIAGWFLEKGQIVMIEDFGEGKEQKKYLSQGPSRLLEYPLVILINEGSASGAEILAGALRDNRGTCPVTRQGVCFGVILIGEKTFGKGSVQEFEKLSKNSSLKGYPSLKITITRWLTPKGELINNKGLEPDIKVEMTEKDYKEERDPQLEKAIEVIKSLD